MTETHAFETRALILTHMLPREGFQVDDDTVRTIAAIVVTDSIRELEGAVIRVCAYASLTGQLISRALAEEALAKVMKVAPPVPITFEAYMRDINPTADIVGQVPPEEVQYRPVDRSTIHADFIHPSISHVAYYHDVALSYIDIDATRPEFWILRSPEGADDGPGLTCYAFTRDETGQHGHVDFVWTVDATYPQLEAVTVTDAFMLYSERMSPRS